VLIDSNAIIHRAYHALPKTMSTRAGEPTNAVYGFATALIKVLEDIKPDYIAASFDLAGPTFRHEAFAEYKATRVKADQELYDQIPRVKEMLSIMEIPIYEKQGFEADDILGTIAQKIQTSNLKPQTYNSKLKNKKKEQNQCKSVKEISGGGVQIFIVSGDKDIFQLIDGNVKVYNLRRGLTDTQIVDREVIEKEYHLQPEDFIDLKALAGDASDNIPGVPGIGDKTATKLIQEFDTLEKLYRVLETQTSNLPPSSRLRRAGKPQTYNLKTDKLIKPRVIELLLKHKDQAFLSQKLATIHKEVPIEFNLDDAKWGEYDKTNLRKFFEVLNFKSLLRRFGIIENDGVKSSGSSTEDQRRKDSQLKLL